ncbi:MAG: tRNA (adenosine(37)-N6)-dimethylallyltransferase MiaA [Gammaproteobacteria bacterium 13_2_20CM_66_19]|nr:MAG: tRNA (adenosine(37)-N6)-dimethylallyltransferase MiaA [Gammaproteobacteria bacterium 13_2_20CM_66_19]
MSAEHAADTAPGAGHGELPVLVLAGPTGAGKTDWAIRLAESAPVEIVSVDSALVYRGLDIGTAKPARELRERVPHHLIDICEPTESYSAGRFVPDAVAAVRDVHARRRVPLLVGGTMLYLRSLLHGLAPLPQADSRLRAELDARAARQGWPALHAELARLDPEAAARVAPTDSQRIQRALEVCYNTGRPISELQRATVSPLAGRRVHYWMLAPPRAVLHERIQRRFEAMMAAGFLEEVRSLRRNGALTARHPSMRAVGYRQLWAHLDGQYPLEEAVRRGVAATRQLAKRQLTWMRGEALGRWIEPEAGLSWNRDICNLLARLGL